MWLFGRKRGNGHNFPHAEKGFRESLLPNPPRGFEVNFLMRNCHQSTSSMTEKHRFNHRPNP
jgi:hypothetical protein